MKMTVLAKPRSKHKKVVKNSDESYTVWVSEPPDKGRANKAIVCALAKHFSVAKSRIELVSGHVGKKKIFNILL